MNIEKMRGEFEAWSAEHEFLGCCVVDRIGNGKYRDFDLQCAWESWQASRAAIEVELPDPWFYPKQEFKLIAQDLTIKAIESLGLKVKS